MTGKNPYVADFWASRDITSLILYFINHEFQKFIRIQLRVLPHWFLNEMAYFEKLDQLGGNSEYTLQNYIHTYKSHINHDLMIKMTTIKIS